MLPWFSRYTMRFASPKKRYATGNLHLSGTVGTNFFLVRSVYPIYPHILHNRKRIGGHIFLLPAIVQRHVDLLK